MLDFSLYNDGDVMWLGDWGSTSIAFLVILGLAIIALSIYDLAPMPPRRRWTLITLRATVYSLAVLMLLEPAIDLKNVSKVKNNVVVLVDGSESMTLDAESGKTRASRAVEAFKNLNLQDSEDHKFHFYEFDSEIQKFGVDQEPSFSGQASDLTSAMLEAKESLGRAELGGLVVISDGTDTGAIGTRVQSGEALDETSKELLSQIGAPINTISVAQPEDIRDIAVAKIRHDDFAFVHNSVTIQAQIKSIGVDETVNVELYRDNQRLQTRQVTLDKNSPVQTVEFEFVPKRIGREVYRVFIEPTDSEILESNNEAFFVQKVIRDKIRVLQVVGRPSWDERFLRQLLKRSPNIDLISFFILRTNENIQTSSNDELSLIPFPTDELFNTELGSFDLVVFQNFNFGPYSMRQYLPQIADFVKKGGGFVMVGGDLSFASGGYAGTAIEDILPVQLPASGSKTLVDTRGFKPNLTDAGTRHPITQLAFDPQANKEIWESLPEQRGTNLVLEARQNATVLATHPSLKSGGAPMPVITVSEMGDGRVMAVTTDSTWRWAFESAATGGTSREYQMFWNSTMRWLIKDPELKLLRIDQEIDLWNPGERPKIGVRIQNPDYTPAQAKEGRIRIQRHDLRTSEALDVPVEIPFVSDARGYAIVSAPVIEEEGIYRISAAATTEAGELTDEDLFLVVSSKTEFRDVVPRPDLLEAIAAHTEGVALKNSTSSVTPLNFQKSTSVQINRRKVVSVWDSFPLFLLILGLLAAEWTFRRRWGRL